MLWRTLAISLAVLVVGVVISFSSPVKNKSNKGEIDSAIFPVLKDQSSIGGTKQHQNLHWSYHNSGKTAAGRAGIVAAGEHHRKRGIDDHLKPLKDKAKKADSVFKWLKKNWRKLCVIIMAIFALVVVIVLYRKCCSDSRSNDDDDDTKVIVVSIPRSDDKAGAGTVRPELNYNVDQELDRRKEREFYSSSSPKPEQRSEMTAILLGENATRKGGKVAAVKGSGTNSKRTDGESSQKCVTIGGSKSGLKDVRLVPPSTGGVPVSGYTALQQIDLSDIPLEVDQYLWEVKTLAHELGAQPRESSHRNMVDGPFPLYEEIPLIKNLRDYMIERCNVYIPTASTQTNLPLTVSP